MVKTMRDKFEGVEKVKNILKECKSDLITFNDEKDEYEAKLYVTFVPEYIEWLNGAWYAFQEQQKKIDAVKEALEKIYKETEGDNELLLKYLDEMENILNESQQE